MKYAVTACNGNLGSTFVREIFAQKNENDTIIGIARTPAKAAFLADELGIEIRKGDYDSQDEFEESLKGIDALLLISSSIDPQKRIAQHRHVIEAAKKAGVKKIVYTSIQGMEEGTGFSPIVQSNRQTEKDIQESGLDWVIGRNGIYIEPDIDYMDEYVKIGAIKNCAGDGKCGYTTRKELAYAYYKMLSEEKHNGHIYNLSGDSLSQKELAHYLSRLSGQKIDYIPVDYDTFKKDRSHDLGDFMGSVIAGIYQGIALGGENNPSDFEKAAGRKHQSWDDYFKDLNT